MSSRPAPSQEVFESQEAAFIKHYDWLIRWALQFTNNDRARAEDLVQEVFAQFAFAHTDLSAVQNVPAYLYATLRNTHVSAVRLAGRSHSQPLSIVEYSIADAALGASDPHSLYQTQDELRRVCQYACVRKQSSRAGSVLILRYFYGYHLSEVAAMLGGTSAAVRQSLTFARNEARLFLQDPGALKFIDKIQTSAPGRHSTSVCAASDLLADLRVAIFRSCQGQCVTNESLRDLYIKGRIAGVDNLTLAHIVSCPQCLDGANRTLGIPLLIERHPADALGPNNNWRGGSGGGTAGPGKAFHWSRRKKTTEEEVSNSFLLRCRRRARELFEHYPAELRVSVNGHVLGSQSVNSDISQLRLDITISEPLSFIEVMSEENARLLVMTVEPPPDGEPMQVRRVGLSEGRHLEVTLRHGHPWPMLEVVYYDPGFTAPTHISTVDVDKLWELNAAPVRPLVHEVVSQSGQVQSNVIVPGETRQAAFFDSLRGLRLFSRPFWYRPGFITAVISLLLVAVILLARMNVAPSISAANLLEKASSAESAIASNSELAIHRVIDLEERRQTAPNVIAKSRIEVWRDGKRDLTARRVYNEKGTLIAAEFSRNHSTGSGSGSRMVYRSDKGPQFESSIRNSREAIDTLELWKLDLSATDFAEIIAHADAARVSEDANVYVISYGSTQAAGSSLVQAALTLRKSDLHALEQTLRVQRAGETFDYRFVEASFDRPPLRDLAPATFELDGGLSRSIVDPVVTPRPQGPTSKFSSITPSLIVASPALEMDLVHLLDPFRLRFGDQLNLVRASDGALEVNGVVDTEDTRKGILRALSAFINHPAVRVRISTAAEVLARRQQQPPDRTVQREFAGSDEAIPVYHDLRTYFSGRQGRGLATESGVDQVVRDFAERVISHSRRAVSHALELKQLGSRFSPAQVDALHPSTRTRWLVMVRGHAEALRREIAFLRGELQPIFFRERGGIETETVELSDSADLAFAIDRLHKVVLANDEIIRSGFAASSDAVASPAVKSARFRASLASSERLAARIQEFAGKDY
jgi:RNA polymerase sigma factor (sigma-70 family)